MRPIYLDASATTPLLPPVWEAMLPYFSDAFGNASSSHRFGRQARRGLDEARQILSHCLDCQPDEILFTSGATEANNLALLGLAGPTPGTLIASPLEHPCVTAPLEQLSQRGFRLKNLPVSADGVILFPLITTPSESPLTPAERERSGGEGGEVSENSLPFPPPDTRIAALMLANHEIGTIQPVRALVDALAGAAPVHCDAAAAAGKMLISFRALGVTSLTVSGHKFHGPKGIGALILRRGSRLPPQIYGGHQQEGKRPGTEPVPLIVGMAKALQLATQNLAANQDHVRQVRDAFLHRLQDAAPLVVNGSLEKSLPFTLNLSFPGCQADALLMKLDLAGIACATGSACSSGSLLPSPVIRALGVSPDVLHSALRFSFLSSLPISDAEEAAERIIKCVNDLRKSTD